MAFTRFTKNVLNVSALPDRVPNQAQTLKATFDQAGVDIKAALNALIVELEASTSADNIGADVQSVATKTVQAILTAFEEAIAERYTKTEADALIATRTNDLVADIDVNLSTGVITMTKKDGTKTTFDTAIEKVPAKFEVVESGDTFALKITNVDGTSTQTDITNFMNIYNFNNSDYITFEVTGEGTEKTVTANIKANSIGLDKLSLSVVSTLEGYMNSARDSATAAKTSETNARASELNALEAENTAVTKAAEATASATAAKTSETNAAESADEAEYWAKQAQGSSQGGDMMKSVYDTNGDGSVDRADNGIIILEASTDNVIDFNTLTEPGIYLIKNCNDTFSTLNSGLANSNESVGFDATLEVRNTRNSNGITIYQERKYGYGTGQINLVSSRAYSNNSWLTWALQPLQPTNIAYGTLGAALSANANAVSTVGSSQIRNIKAQTTDLTAGTSTLATGDIVLIYE